MTEGTGKRSFHYGWVILILAVMTVTGALGFARFGYSMVLNPMKEGLGLSDGAAGDLATANLVGYLLLSLACGFLSAKFGPRAVISVSLAIVAAAMALTGLSGNYVSALAARFLTGMGSGGANVTAMGLISAWFATRRRGLATGIAVSGSSFGLLITGIFLPLIFAAGGGTGWRYAWFFLAALTLVFALLVLVFLRNRPADKGLAPVGAAGDGSGSAASGQGRGWRAILKTPAVYHLAAIYVLFGFAYIIYSMFYSRYLVKEGSFTVEDAGRFWAVIGAFSIASGFLWGWVSDRAGRKIALAVVFVIQAASFIVFGLWKSMPGYLLSSFLFALTAWSIPAIMAASCGDLLGPELAPAALGFITLFFGIGQAVGPALAGRIADLTGSFSPAFVIAGAASLLGGIGALFLKGKKP
jgi:predicted MFS family arabinose efflux permease